MCEMIKDFERLERERWEETALVCPARDGKVCRAMERITRCEFLSCWARFIVLQFQAKI